MDIDVIHREVTNLKKAVAALVEGGALQPAHDDERTAALEARVADLEKKIEELTGMSTDKPKSKKKPEAKPTEPPHVAGA